jgi:hypothetical protein
VLLQEPPAAWLLLLLPAEQLAALAAGLRQPWAWAWPLLLLLLLAGSLAAARRAAGLQQRLLRVLLGALVAGWMLSASGQPLQLQVAAAAALPWLCLQVCCCLLSPVSPGAAGPAHNITWHNTARQVTTCYSTEYRRTPHCSASYQIMPPWVCYTITKHAALYCSRTRVLRLA